MDYLITDFGARSCDQLQTEAIQKALDTCFLNGGGTVIIPAGIFLTGGLRLRSNTTLYLQSGSILKGSSDPEDYTGYINDTIEPINEPYDGVMSRNVYPFSRWNNAIIRSIDAENIAVIGEPGSWINGSNCYDPLGERDYRGPHGLNIQRSKNIRVEGVSIADTGNWAVTIFTSRDIEARNLRIYGGHDGIDLRTCDNVLIEDCSFTTGDDCIAGFDAQDVVIRNCYMDTACNALRLGGNHILVENCHAYAPSAYGFRGTLSAEKKAAGALTDSTCRHNCVNFFQYYCDFRAKIRKAPGDIVIRNCRIENSDCLFGLYFDGNHKWCTNRSLNSITFEDCEISGVSIPAHIHSDSNEPLDFTLNRVTIRPKEGFEDLALIDTIYHAGIHLNQVRLEGFTEPTIIARTDGPITVENSTPVKIQKAE